MTRDWVHVVGHSPVFQILLQIVVTMSIMASPPAWTNSTGMLSTPADFPIFSALTTASTSSRRIEWYSASSIYGQSSTIGTLQSHSCKGLSSLSQNLHKLASKVMLKPYISLYFLVYPIFGVFPRTEITGIYQWKFPPPGLMRHATLLFTWLFAEITRIDSLPKTITPEARSTIWALVARAVFWCRYVYAMCKTWY